MNIDYFDVITYAVANIKATEQGKKFECNCNVTGDTLGIFLWDKDDVMKFYPVKHNDKFIKE